MSFPAWPSVIPGLTGNLFRRCPIRSGMSEKCRVSPKRAAGFLPFSRTERPQQAFCWGDFAPYTPLVFKNNKCYPNITHCVPRINRYSQNSIAWWFFRKFTTSLKWPSMYSLKWLHLYRLPVRQTYQRKCFRFLLWECGSFLSQGITKYAYARALYILYAPTLGAYTLYVPECGVYQ